MISAKLSSAEIRRHMTNNVMPELQIRVLRGFSKEGGKRVGAT
jgi:hypothetical protein